METPSPAAPKKEPSSTLIYVSNLPFNVRDEQLRDLFKGFDVKTAYVAVRRNGRSKGFGFVNLASTADQTKAIGAVDGKEFEGRKLTAKVAYNDDRRNEKGELLEQYKKQLPTRNEGPPSETVVYVSNLPWAYKDEDLTKLFSDLKVKNSNVAVRRNGRSKGFGFVEFETKEDQQKALEQDQKKIDDRVITVKASVNYRGPNNQPRPESNGEERRPRRERRSPRRSGSRRSPRRSTGGKNVTVQRSNGGRQSGASAPRTENTLYISNLPFELEDGDLKSIFNEFNVKSAHVATRGGSGRSLGFGFVEFGNPTDQKNALEALDQSEVNGRVISIKVATGRSTRPPRREGGERRERGERREGGDRRGGERRRRSRSNSRSDSRGGERRRVSNEKREPSQTLLYVSNLPFTVEDAALQKVFAGFKVAKAYVAKRGNGRSKGFGFVEFASHEEQQKALKLNGQEFEGRPLTIQVANKVEDTKEAEAKN